MMENRVLYALPLHVRQLLTAFLITVSIGFTLGAFFVEHTTSLDPPGIAERFKGTEEMGIDIDSLPEGRELQAEKSKSDLLNITHTHILALSMVFLLVGGIFSYTTILPAWLKSFVLIEPFVSLVATFGGMWLVRYGSAGWSWLLAASGLLMFACFSAMAAVSIIEMWMLPRKTR